MAGGGHQAERGGLSRQQLARQHDSMTPSASRWLSEAGGGRSEMAHPEGDGEAVLLP